MPRVAVLELSQGEIALPRLRWHLQAIVNTPQAAPLRPGRSRLTRGSPAASFPLAVAKLPLLCGHEGRKETQSGL